jgi:hypothetical protein
VAIAVIDDGGGRARIVAGEEIEVDVETDASETRRVALSDLLPASRWPPSRRPIPGAELASTRRGCCPTPPWR